MTRPEEKTENGWPPEDALDRALLRFPPADRAAWRAEALRLGEILSEYARIKPKRRRDTKTGKYELECHLVERRVGVLEEFGVKRLLARGYNAKEKPVERFFKDVSEWEANTFSEYCGSHPHARPDRVTVRGADVTGVELRLLPRAAVEGKVVLDPLPQRCDLPDGRAYFVMQYVPGRTLRSVMTPHGMNPKRAADLRRTPNAIPASSRSLYTATLSSRRETKRV